jgi:hypothetical protein
LLLRTAFKSHPGVAVQHALRQSRTWRASVTATVTVIPQMRRNLQRAIPDFFHGRADDTRQLASRLMQRSCFVSAMQLTLQIALRDSTKLISENDIIK